MTHDGFKKMLLGGAVAGLLSVSASAGVPVNNLQGVGGVAFNPLAYLAGLAWEDKQQAPLCGAVRKPQIGAWYIDLSDADIDWTCLSAATSVFDRVEISYGREIVSCAGTNIHKDNVGLKLLLIPENAGECALVPAVSVGAVWKQTSMSLTGDESDIDVYAVATKLITEPLPMPVLLSGGLLSSSEWATGVLGFDEDDRDITAFANIDIIPHEKWAVGFEYKQGSSYDDLENADKWNIHVCFLANKNLTVIGAWVDAGDEDSSSELGCGDGFVFSLQYAF